MEKANSLIVRELIRKTYTKGFQTQSHSGVPLLLSGLLWRTTNWCCSGRGLGSGDTNVFKSVPKGFLSTVLQRMFKGFRCYLYLVNITPTVDQKRYSLEF